MGFPFLGFLLLSYVFFPSSCYGKLSSVLFDDGFNRLYGHLNVNSYEDGRSVSICMDENTSSGFHSKAMYKHGHFSASIKLPENNTAGVVVAFYTANNQKHPYNHDEIDFEFLGHITGQDWLVQTNFYGNGSTNKGREERYVLPFDPSQDFHQYSILWTDNRIVYYVDEVPIREVQRPSAMGGDWPSKPMTLYGTIWNGSQWATSGGKYKLDLTYSPFIAKFSNFMLNGCPIDQIQLSPNCGENPEFAEILSGITPDQRIKMEGFRRKHMTYSHCYDKNRYAVPLPECVIDAEEVAHLQRFDPWTFGKPAAAAESE